MNKKTIISLIVVILTFLSPQQYAHVGTIMELDNCLEQQGTYWSNEEQACKLMEETTGCKQLDKYTVIETQNLPIDYENITGNYDYNNSLIVDVFCGGEFLKPDNTTCEEYISKINNGTSRNYFEGISHYRLMLGTKLAIQNKTIELCWS